MMVRTGARSRGAGERAEGTRPAPPGSLPAAVRPRAGAAAWCCREPGAGWSGRSCSGAPGPAMGDVKNYLYAWCGRRRVMPVYEIRAAGGRGRQTFLCEVRACPVGGAGWAPSGGLGAMRGT